MIPSIKSMKDAFSLEGKNAIITGGNRGIGAGIARAFAESGADIAIFCRDQAKAAEQIAELASYGGKYEAFSCDVSDLDSCKAAVEAACASFGTFDILVNNAGIGDFAMFLDDEDLATWRRVISVDLIGTANMTYVVAKRMRDAGKGGAIVNITSNAGFMVNGDGGMSGYATAKAGANHFTHCMAAELGPYDIRVNAIAPGFTTTELSSLLPPEAVEMINAQAVTGRFGETIEIGALAVYLASPAAAQVTGEVSVIDGGFILRR